jgi:hypothetical protein
MLNEYCASFRYVKHYSCKTQGSMKRDFVVRGSRVSRHCCTASRCAAQRQHARGRHSRSQPCLRRSSARVHLAVAQGVLVVWGVSENRGVSVAASVAVAWVRPRCTTPTRRPRRFPSSSSILRTVRSHHGSMRPRPLVEGARRRRRDTSLR